MGLSTAQRTTILHRREMVAQLRLRGLSERAIAKMMAESKEGAYLNPETGEPWSSSTIHLDIVALEKDWRENALRDITSIKGEHLAELVEVKRAGWAAKDLDVVLKALKQVADV